MATVLHKTAWSVSSGTTATITIPAASAGSTLVITIAGGAISTAKITNSGGAAFTPRTPAYVGGNLDVSIHDFIAVGGETAVFVTLSGAATVGGTIYEIAGLGAFVPSSSSRAGTGISRGIARDFQYNPTKTQLASGSGVLISTFGYLTSNPAQSWRQLGPAGVLDQGQAPSGGSTMLFASGLADITSAGAYPANAGAGFYAATSQQFEGGDGYAAQAMYADTSGLPSVTFPNAIAKENSLPGTHHGNWHTGHDLGTDPTIAGFTDKTSYSAGDTVNFKVDSANTFRVEIYRLGHYGVDLCGARNVIGYQDDGFLTGTPTTQITPAVDPTLGSASCVWDTSATWAIPANAVPGVYWVLFRRTDAGNTTKFATCHFIVKSDVTDKAVVVLPDLTYQAYNSWGATTNNGDRAGTYTGRSLYELGVDNTITHRAYAVSFDRPYAVQQMRYNTYLLDAEQPFILFAEAQGYDLTYLSTLDLDANTALLNNARLIMLPGHHEYWTTNVYDCLTNAVDAGVNMLVHSGNTALWHVRFAAGDTDRRTMICYKDSQTVDVGAGFTGTGRDPGGYTGSWRDVRTAVAPNNPDVRRENALTGQMFIVNGIVGTMQVRFADKGAPMWRNHAQVQALTTGQAWTTAQQVLGGEVDGLDGSGTQPANLVKISNRTASGTTATNNNGTIYSTTFTNLDLGFTLYRRSSGALVFNGAAWECSWGLDRYVGASYDEARTPDVDWQNAWLALIYDLSVAPTTLRKVNPPDPGTLVDPATGAPGPTRNDVARAYGLIVADTVDGAGSASFSFSAGGVGHVISRGIGAASAGYSAAGAAHSITHAVGSARYTFSASGTGTITSTGVSRNVTVTITLAPGTPHEVHTSLGGREYVGLTLSSDLDISADAVQLSLGSWATPGTWHSPSLDDHGQLNRTVALLVGGDVTPTVGSYYVWMKLPDSPEVVVMRYSGNTILID